MPEAVAARDSPAVPRADVHQDAVGAEADQEAHEEKDGA